MSSSCVQGRCLCRTGMHIGPDGACHSGWWPTCNLDTKGTCHWFGCSASRGATDCVSGRCLCKAGSCAQNGACVEPTELATNATLPLGSFAEDPEVIRSEDWEVFVNLATAAGFACLTVAMASGSALLVWHLKNRRRGGKDFTEKLLPGTEGEGVEAVVE